MQDKGSKKLEGIYEAEITGTTGIGTTTKVIYIKCEELHWWYFGLSNPIEGWQYHKILEYCSFKYSCDPPKEKEFPIRCVFHNGELRGIGHPTENKFILLENDIKKEEVPEETIKLLVQYPLDYKVLGNHGFEIEIWRNGQVRIDYIGLPPHPYWEKIYTLEKKGYAHVAKDGYDLMVLTEEQLEVKRKIEEIKD